MKKIAAVVLSVLILSVAGYFILHIHKQNIEYRGLSRGNITPSVNDGLSNEEAVRMDTDEGVPTSEDYTPDFTGPRAGNDILLIY